VWWCEVGVDPPPPPPPPKKLRGVESGFHQSRRQFPRLRNMSPSLFLAGHLRLASSSSEPRIPLRLFRFEVSAIPTTWRRARRHLGNPTSTPPFAPTGASSNDRSTLFPPPLGLSRLYRIGGSTAGHVAELTTASAPYARTRRGGSSQLGATRLAEKSAASLHKRFASGHCDGDRDSVHARPVLSPRSNSCRLMRSFAALDLRPRLLAAPGYLRQDLSAAFLDQCGLPSRSDPVHTARSACGERATLAVGRFVDGAHLRSPLDPNLLGLRIPNLARESALRPALHDHDGRPPAAFVRPWYTAITTPSCLSLDKRSATASNGAHLPYGNRQGRPCQSQPRARWAHVVPGAVTTDSLKRCTPTAATRIWLALAHHRGLGIVTLPARFW